MEEDHKVRTMKSELLKRMYGLQEEINQLYRYYTSNSEIIQKKEKEIGHLFIRLRRLREHEQKIKG